MNEKIASFYWFVIWLGCGFGIPETLALVTGHPQYTLSDAAWRLLDVLPGNTYHQFSFLRLLVGFLLVWLFFHIEFGWFR